MIYFSYLITSNFNLRGKDESEIMKSNLKEGKKKGKKKGKQIGGTEST